MQHPCLSVLESFENENDWKNFIESYCGHRAIGILKLFFPKQKQKGRGILAGSLLLYKLICILSCIDCSIAIKQIPLFLLGNHHRSNNKYRIILIYLLFFLNYSNMMEDTLCDFPQFRFLFAFPILLMVRPIQINLHASCRLFPLLFDQNQDIHASTGKFHERN